MKKHKSYACHGFINGNILSKVDVENKATTYSYINTERFITTIQIAK